MRPNDETYIPRTDLGFPDRRQKGRLEVRFTDEADVERWELGDRSSESDRLLPASTES